MSISLDEVRRIAALARLGIDDAEGSAMARELSSILEHMQILARASDADVESSTRVDSGAMPLRPDTGPPIPLARTPGDFAPEFRDGFFLVPRLTTHEDLESAS